MMYFKEICKSTGAYDIYKIDNNRVYLFENGYWIDCEVNYEDYDSDDDYLDNLNNCESLWNYIKLSNEDELFLELI